MALLAWEDGTTTIAIKNMDTFACEVDFQYSLQQGVKLKLISSVCSGSSSQSNDDVIDKLGNHKFYLKTAEGIELECEIGAALLEDSKSLSEEVLSSSLKCEAVEADCITVEGEVYPAQCVIPFNYNGRRYLGCTDRPGSTKLWCPTKTDETGGAEDDLWGFCSKKCGYCGGSPITTRDGQEESCGYDCLLGAEWEMVGYDKAPLFKPTIDISLPKEANYIAEKGGQHQLNIGPQSVTISCPETKFYDPALKQETLVRVRCGPAKYRLTVTSESGATLGGNFRNDQFGCDPCPSSYSYIPGFLLSGDFSSNGIFYDVKTVQKCKAVCEESCLCLTFDFSNQQSRCQIIKELITKPSFSSIVGDHVLCAKEETPQTSDTCGIDSSLDSDRLIAELNTNYIFSQVEHTKDKIPSYRTTVYDVICFDSQDKPKNMLDEIPGSMENTEPGIFFLFLAPPSSQCNSQTIEDASSAGEGYYPLFVGVSSNFNTPIEIFISKANELKKNYNGKFPKLCAIGLRMKNGAAQSRVKNLESLFNFYLNNNNREFKTTKGKVCQTADETRISIVNSDIFDTSARLEFKEQNHTVFESDGFARIVINKMSSFNKKTVGFVATNFDGAVVSCIPASENDIFPLFTAIVFKKLETEGEVIVRIKEDKEDEKPECVLIEIYKSTDILHKANNRWPSIWPFTIKIVDYSTQIMELGTPKVIRRYPSFDQWETSLLKNLIEDTLLDNHNIVLAYTRWEQHSPIFVGEDYKTEFLVNDFLFGIIKYYKGSLITRSCDHTATALSMTFLNQITMWRMKEKHEQYDGSYDGTGIVILQNPSQYIPWDKGLALIRKQLHLKKVVKIELNIEDGGCGNHMFVMWKKSQNQLGIVHGYQSKFYARYLYHKDLDIALGYLQDLLKPVKEPKNAVEHKKRITFLQDTYKKFFGKTLKDVPVLVEPNRPHNVYDLKEVMAGYPSDEISSVKNACLKSTVIQNNLQATDLTKILCNNM